MALPLVASPSFLFLLRLCLSLCRVGSQVGSPCAGGRRRKQQPQREERQTGAQANTHTNKTQTKHKHTHTGHKTHARKGERRTEHARAGEQESARRALLHLRLLAVPSLCISFSLCLPRLSVSIRSFPRPPLLVSSKERGDVASAQLRVPVHFLQPAHSRMSGSQRISRECGEPSERCKMIKLTIDLRHVAARVESKMNCPCSCSIPFAVRAHRSPTHPLLYATVATHHSPFLVAANRAHGSPPCRLSLLPLPPSPVFVLVSCRVTSWLAVRRWPPAKATAPARGETDGGASEHTHKQNTTNTKEQQNTGHKTHMGGGGGGRQHATAGRRWSRRFPRQLASFTRTKA